MTVGSDIILQKAVHVVCSLLKLYTTYIGANVSYCGRDDDICTGPTQWVWY